MTIVYSEGDRFWIEQHTVNLTLTDAAGQVSTAAQLLDKAGSCIGYSVTAGGVVSNDNSQAVAIIALLDQGAGTIGLGEIITAFIVRVTKQVGTDGNTILPLTITLIMRGTGS